MTSSPEPKAISHSKGPWKSLTERNVMYCMPIQGALSYSALSVKVMCPTLMLSGIHHDIILSTLFLETLLGTGLYLYGREHLQTASIRKRIFFSAFGAFSFTLASINLWKTLRNIVPQDLAMCAACGIGSGWALIILGRRYCDYVDSTC